MGDATREPAWAWAAAGILGYLTWRGGGPPPAGPPVSAADAARWAPRDDPARMTVRDLRRMPGVGERRATAAAQARWAHDPTTGPLEWIAVPGIGDVTAARVAAWLEERGRPAHAPLSPGGSGAPGRPDLPPGLPGEPGAGDVGGS